MITHSFIVACLESYAMADKQIRLLARILPDNWELLFVDDGSDPEIPIPAERPKHFRMLRTGERRGPGEWTQKLAINRAVPLAFGGYFIKSDIDHVFTAEAIAAAEAFTGDMMLFERSAARLTSNLELFALDHAVYPKVDDIFVMRRELFLSLGGYPADATRRYGTAGKAFWHLSRKAEADPAAGARIFVVPDTIEKYHGLARATA